MIRGYVADTPYVRSFTRELAPAWLDHVVLVSGFAPPERDAGFAYCDLGCGYGFTSAVVAGAHPRATIHGIDVNRDHVESANRFARDAGIANAIYQAASFDESAGFPLPKFDYIVSHGVYSWVDDEARRSWLHFVDRHLKAGGVLYVSYNAIPGRAADLPLQRLVHSLGNAFEGDSQQRTLSAIQTVIPMIDMKVPALVASPLATRLRESMDKLSPGYLTHELMGSNWEPLCVTDVRKALAPIGLQPSGSATLMENYDSFVLGRAARDMLATIPDANARELVRDYFIDQFFRRDVFIRGSRRLPDEERRSRLLQSAWCLAQPAASVEYNFKTPAGRLRFDNAVSREIVAALAAGPRRLMEVAGDSSRGREVLANALTLSAAGAIWPVETDCPPVSATNEAIFERNGSAEEIRHVVLPFGTAVPASRELLACLKAGIEPNDEYGRWVALQLGGIRPLSSQ